MKRKSLFAIVFVFCSMVWSQNNLVLSNLPAQITINQNETKDFQFDADISKVVSRRRDVASFVISGKTVTIDGLKAGRTGLKITTVDNRVVYIGLRINNLDGSVPALPNYLAIGSVSEDTNEDLGFWQDMDGDLTNKRMDIRYIYINGGVSALGNGWRTWGGDRVGKFCEESIRAGLVPFFVYYNIPDGGESYETDLAHARNPEYMTGYFDDLNYFFQRVEAKLNGDLYGIILEPDFLGYLQQLGPVFGESADPALIKTAVGTNTIGANAGSITTLVERINKAINQKKMEGHKIIFGWQVNLWSYGTRADGSGVQGSKGVIRRTDDLGFVAGRALIKEAAENTASFAMKAGILSNGADFVSIDKYGLDAMGYQNTVDPAQSTWFFNSDHWNNYIYYVENLHLTSNKPIVLWQLPVGRINATETVSSYTGQKFPDLDNSNMKYEDSTPNFFFGDTFTASTTARQNYFSQNLYNDGKMTVSGSKITWASHIQETKNAGVLVALFGAGVGNSTDGVGSPPTENYFWIQKVQEYYNAPVAIDAPFDGTNIACDVNCPPIVIPVSPSINNQKIIVNAGDSVYFSASIYDLNGTVASVKFEIIGTVCNSTSNNKNYRVGFIPSTFGNYLFKITAVDNGGNTTVKEVTAIISEFDPLACTIPAWEAKIYATTTQISYNSMVYQNQYYASEADVPTVSSAWKYIEPCGDVNLLIDPCKTAWVAQDYAGNSKVAYNGSLWQNSYWAVATDVPGVSGAWSKVGTCNGIDVMINVKGSLSFANVALNHPKTRTLTIANSGTTDLIVQSLTCPAGFSGNWSGKILAGKSQLVDITFTPTVVGNYSGLIKVVSNATGGHYAMPAYGNGVVATSIDDEIGANITSEIKIYPNPAHSFVMIELPAELIAANCNVSLLDMQGRTLAVVNGFDDSLIRIDTDGFANGLYIVKIASANKVYSKLISISKGL